MTTNSDRASTTEEDQPTLVIFRAECGSGQLRRAMKDPWQRASAQEAEHDRGVALFWRRSVRSELSGAWFIGVLVVRGGAGSVGERAAVGVAFEGRRLGQHHDPSILPPRADPQVKTVTTIWRMPMVV